MCRRSAPSWGIVFRLRLLLSHDLIEGTHAGVGLASDIELFENLPLDYASYCQRQHRWIRGDWQIAPWIFPRVPTAAGGKGPNPLSVIGPLAHFRQSAAQPGPGGLSVAAVFGWLISAAPGVWSLVVGLAIAIPAVRAAAGPAGAALQGAVRGWQGAADELIARW